MLFANGLIGLREGLEAALVVSILIAFLVKTDRRHALKWVWVGVVTAVVLSVTAGAVITFAGAGMSFEQQEAFGGTMSIIAVAFVTGMIFWMRRAAKTIAAELRGKMDQALQVGPVAVVVVSFLSVGREGLETAVFFYSSVQAAGGGAAQPLIGFLAGIAVAVAIAAGLYAGAIRFDLGKFFTVTGVLLVFVAAGVLSYGIHDLQEAAILPGLNTLAFDISDVLPEDSWYGAVLKGFFNYSQRTSVLQAVAWVSYVAVVLSLFLVRPRVRAAA
ncbi:iron uptake transporter permease EfeU [Nocardia sp. NRRL S-836]|uniref:iron uptake transporter permease EfeU n=1 Tax=Nocardia sp. NRRL S-836 TaxID=1519492 RepID=UPI0006B03DE2|nr:iron uptake transporter permease EfeU [Nocardia sp. NRRL S-836]KOV89663.1 iron transporter [Nocardia sp. NRRL S-836]